MLNSAPACVAPGFWGTHFQEIFTYLFGEHQVPVWGLVPGPLGLGSGAEP